MYSSSDVNVSYDVGLNRGSLGRLALMALACLISSSALATTISPVKVELSRANPVVTITVTNNADLPMIFQSQVFSWTQSDGENHLAESTDLLVAPAIAEIEPRGTQVFRITQRHPTVAIAERAYRLVLDDISGTNHPNAGEGVNFVFSHRLPVFVAGTGNTGPQPHLGKCPNSSQLGCVRLQNKGDQYVQVRSLVVSGQSWQEELGAGQRILAGAWLQWTFELPPVSAGRLTVTAETSVGRMSFELPNAAPSHSSSIYDVPQ